MISPIFLKPSYAWRSYKGGSYIAKLKGEKGEDSNFPEEWIMSVVRAENPGREDIVEGLSMDFEGKFLRDIISYDPKSILGVRHFNMFGETTGVLLKILDAAERLAVQVHPSKEMAKKLFDSPFGKTECWHIIDTRDEEACVYIGFKKNVTREKWTELFKNQDIEGMLNCLHKFDVKNGDTFLITGGTPHAIGKGCLLVEIQEPTDYTICTERYCLDGSVRPDEKLHKGLGFERMFDCFDYYGVSHEEADKKWHIPKTIIESKEEYVLNELIGYKDTKMFSMREILVNESYTIDISDVFSGIYVLDGEGILDGKNLKAGSQIFMPANCPKTLVVNTGKKPLRMVRFFGPEC